MEESQDGWKGGEGAQGICIGGAQEVPWPLLILVNTMPLIL